MWKIEIDLMFCICSLPYMSADADLAPHRATLQSLAEMTMAMTEQVYAQAMASQGDKLIAVAGLFCDLGRSLRLTLALDLRLAAFNPAVAVARSVAKAAETSDAATPAERREYPERERETETERDGFPMDPMGRVQALERIITRNPTLDSDHRVGAEIIQLKAFLTQPEPPTPVPPTANTAPPATLGRPLNRTERRRQRHASG